MRTLPSLRICPQFPTSAFSGFRALTMLSAAFAFLACLFADRATKALVDRRLSSTSISLGPVGRVRRIVSRRHHRSSNQTILVATWCAALVCAIVLHLRLGWFAGQSATLGLGAAFGGAAGNLSDVLRSRPIIDFVDLRFWPAFNVADVAIVVGLLMAFVVP